MGGDSSVVAAAAAIRIAKITHGLGGQGSFAQHKDARFWHRDRHADDRDVDPRPLGPTLDPGTGSIILQVLLGGVAGLLLAGKLFWHRILTTLGLRRDEAEPDATRAQQAASDAPTRE